MNFLEQMVTEWYRYRDHFVKTNAKFGRLAHGGYKGEADVIALRPHSYDITHIETSTDADSWERRNARFTRKFADAAEHYAEIIGFEPQHVTRIAIVSFNRMIPVRTFGADIRVVGIYEMVNEVLADLRTRNPLSDAVPEEFGLLRALQYGEWARAQGPPQRSVQTQNPFGLTESESAGGPSYWIVPAQAEPGYSAPDSIKRMLDHRIFGLGERTPGRQAIKPGDWLAFYASGEGVVGYARAATQASLCEHAAITRPDDLPYVLELQDVKVYTDAPIVVDRELRQRLSYFQSVDPGRNWGTFVRNVRAITKDDFAHLTGIAPSIIGEE